MRDFMRYYYTQTLQYLGKVRDGGTLYRLLGHRRDVLPVGEGCSSARDECPTRRYRRGAEVA